MAVRGGLAVAAVALTAAAWIARARWLLETDAPIGTDGYYYVVQAEDWLALGRLHVPDASWVLRALASPAALGVDLIVGLKLMAAALAAAAAPAVVAVAWRAGAPAAACLALGLWAAASPTLSHLAADFPKNLGAVAPLMLALGLGAPRPGRAPWAWALAALAAAMIAATAHRVGAALVGAGAVGLVLGQLLRGARAPGRRGAALVALGVGALAALAFAALAAALPGLLHPADLIRLEGQLDLSWHWPAPWSWLPHRATPRLEAAEIASAWAAVGVGAWAALRRPGLRPAALACLAPLAVCLFPLWRGETLDLGYRLSLMAPPLGMALLAVVAGRWGAEAPLPLTMRPRGLAVALGGAVALPAAIHVGLAHPPTPPYERYEAIIAAIPRPLPELLIAHQGVNFLYDHLTGGEAMAWAPEPELDRARVGRLVFGVRDGEWLAFERAHPHLPPPTPLDVGYDYCREDVWEALNAWARLAGDDDLLDRLAADENPTRLRPESLTRGRD